MPRKVNSEPRLFHPVTWDYEDIIVVVKDPKQMGLGCNCDAFVTPR